MRVLEPELAVPGVIGVRGSLVRVGPDAGFPGFQALDEWKSGVLLVEARALTDAAKRAAGVTAPDDELAELDALDRELVEAGAPPMGTPRQRACLRLAAAARMLPVTVEQAETLAGHGAEIFDAGYTRHSATLWVHRGDSRGFVSRYAASTEHPRPGWPPGERYSRTWEATLLDRVLRALSGGLVSVDGLLYARRRSVRWQEPELLETEDEVTLAAREAAMRIANVEDRVAIPGHGTAQRVRLAAFRAPVRDAIDGGAAREIEVPAEDVWVLPG